ncbi:transcriptional regulator LysR family protein [Calothrix parasitica NIES-267]|uniref:Transcriptional regulator LysR family protein n=1 Tax=Calothrix parasitica NIES-267 TaxID=1973488 RepID=A0A1Z4LH63_9CYAN|nr:transcriptional regulator LysR family protein [Calothrix parasitica NIES-267]
MDLSVLQIFVEVMRHGSFAAVGRERNIDPSSVSRTIAGLESELGIRLFQRTTRKLSPTEAGVTYFERVEPLIEEIQQAADIAKDISGNPKGTIRVTSSVSFGLKCIVPLLPEFEAKYPELTVDLLLTDSVVDLFTERIDVAIRLGQLADSTLIIQKLMETRYSVCASPDYLKRYGQPQIPKDIEEHNCLLFPLIGFRSRWIFKNKTGNIQEISVGGNTIISNAIALQQCAVSGMGLTLLPHWLIDEDIDIGKLVKLFPDYKVTATDFNTAAWLLYPSRAYIPFKVRVFVEELRKHILAYGNL